MCTQFCFLFELLENYCNKLVNFFSLVWVVGALWTFFFFALEVEDCLDFHWEKK